jgi:hypothetical protein
MDFFPAIWNVIHDGSIIAVRGTVPGTVRFDVSIQYLRERFTDPGEVIQVTLTDCTRFAYRDYEAEDFCTDLPAIAASEPEVLSAELRGDMSEVCCVGGTLEVRASGGSLALDSERAITLQELVDVSEAYWTEWSERAKQARQTT